MAGDDRFEQLQAQIDDLRGRIQGQTALRDRWRHWGILRGDNAAGALSAISTPAKPSVTVLMGYVGGIYQKTAETVISLGGSVYNRILQQVAGNALSLEIATIQDGGFALDDFARVVTKIDTGVPSVEITASSGGGGVPTYFRATDVTFNAPVALDTDTGDPSSPADGWVFYRSDTDRIRLRANGAWADLIASDHASWTDLTDGGATTLHSHALPATYTRVYYKDQNGTSGRGPAATTNETSLGSFTVTGGDMGTTGILRVRLMGISVGSGATRTVRIRVKFGGSTIYDDTSATSALDVPWFADIHVANVGSASTQRTGGFILIGTPTATTGYGDLSTDELLAATPIYATSSINTASNQTFEVTAQLSDGTTPNSFICFSMVAELL